MPNEVPKKGGHYSAEDGAHDNRCFNSGSYQCYNKVYKKRIKSEITDILLKGFGESGSKLLNKFEEDLLHGIVDRIANETRLRDLIEFSRAVHAEMDAIVSIVRAGNNSLDGCEMFTTTFPCHICAKHIIAAGIKAVYYIEPYEKSLAIELHDDE